jgi:hypothetical protein
MVPLSAPNQLLVRCIFGSAVALERKRPTLSQLHKIEPSQFETCQFINGGTWYQKVSTELHFLSLTPDTQ